jgi:hypothetical protein
VFIVRYKIKEDIKIYLQNIAIQTRSLFFAKKNILPAI